LGVVTIARSQRALKEMRRKEKPSIKRCLISGEVSEAQVMIKPSFLSGSKGLVPASR